MRSISPVLLGKLALIAAVLAVGLVTYGSWVRASGSGLGCPDWPLCNGKIIPTTTASAIESGHRWYAAITGLVIFAAAALGTRLRRLFPRAAGMLLLSAVMVIAQALLGAAVVLTELHPFIRLAHMGLALALIGVLTISGTALLQNKEPVLSLRRPGWHLLPTAVIVVLLGGSIVATATSFACADFPLCDGSSSKVATALHSAHRTMGVVLFLGAAAFVLRRRKLKAQGAFYKASIVAAVLLAAQLGIGVALVAMRLPMDLRVLHIGMAAAVWFALVTAWSLAALAPKKPAARRVK